MGNSPTARILDSVQLGYFGSRLVCLRVNQANLLQSGGEVRVTDSKYPSPLMLVAPTALGWVFRRPC